MNPRVPLQIATLVQPIMVNARFQRLRLASGDYDPSTTVQQGTPFQAQLGLRFSF